MNFNKSLIELILLFYPECKKDLLISNKDNNIQIFVVLCVEKWFEILYYDEKELLTLRFFKKKTYEYITYYLGYKNHSSTIRKKDKIINKILDEFYR